MLTSARSSCSVLSHLLWSYLPQRFSELCDYCLAHPHPLPPPPTPPTTTQERLTPCKRSYTWDRSRAGHKKSYDTSTFSTFCIAITLSFILVSLSRRHPPVIYSRHPVRYGMVTVLSELYC
jgi:hypothetical protein